LKAAWRQAGRLLALLALCTLCLQAVFAARVALMAFIDPQSTSFQRSEAWRLLRTEGRITWAQQWVGADQLSPQLQRAVIASEDAGFSSHGGVEWEAIERAWETNQRRAERAARRQASGRPASVRLVGGSTITQQLAKNLFLSGERNVLRKAQELLISFYLEAFLSKERILTIYLNNVEWGEGLFGAQAAARHYFRTDAARLSAAQAARLAVMLPAPKRFEQRPASPYLLGRAQAVQARMGDVALP
jgi:monofunctional biosynthetic peptidoglycan transglycosylase